MSLYDVNGNTIAQDGVTSEQVKTALMGAIADGSVNLGSAVGATLAYNNLPAAWLTNANAAYAALLAKYKALANGAIPFFVSTDQHGRGVEQHRWANNADADGMEFANINLGDTVQDYFNYAELDSMLARTKQVKNYISITGNHDALYRGNDVPTIYDLSKYFISTKERTVIPKVNSSYTVYDRAHDVKFVVGDSYNSVGTVLNGLGNSELTGDFADWLIAELGRDDCDIVYLQHWQLYAEASVYKRRDGTPDTNAVGGSPTLRNLITARRNKSSGSVTDSVGTAHAYDFSGCKHNLLCALHGHEHDEVYATLDNLLCYAADWYGNNKSCVFGLIDRAGGKLWIWKFSAESVADTLELSL